MSDLALAARDYFDASDKSTAHGKTRMEFELACQISFHTRQLLREALEAYEMEQYNR